MSAKQEIWILTSEVNDYNQYGEYFLDAFPNKPSAEQVWEVIKSEYGSYTRMEDQLNTIEFILDGGGRQGVDNIWFNLKKVL